MPLSKLWQDNKRLAHCWCLYYRTPISISRPSKEALEGLPCRVEYPESSYLFSSKTVSERLAEGEGEYSYRTHHVYLLLGKSVKFKDGFVDY